MPSQTHRVREAITRLATDDNLDLWLLTAAAAVFTVLGIVGVADESVLASAILAFLALLAVSQIRSRRHLEELARAQRTSPTDLLRSDFPENFTERRNQARDVLLIGVALSRTIQTYLEPLRAALTSGAQVRIMVVDPELHDTLRGLTLQAAYAGPSRASRRIRNSLDELTHLHGQAGGNLEIRVSPSIPGIGVNVFDPATSNGLLSVQHYEYGASAEPSPIVLLRPADGHWFQHFRAEAERLWADGRPWPDAVQLPAPTSPAP